MTQITLGDWLQTWIDTYAPLRCSSGVTIERYQRLARYLSHTPRLAAASATALPHLTHQQLETSILTLLKAPALRKDHLSRRSIRHFASLLHVALEKACWLDLIHVNPMTKVELPPADPPDARSLTLDEVRRLRQVCRGDWTYVFVDLALATGLRRGELLALEWRDLDWNTRVLSVSKSLEETRKGLRLKKPKNGRSRRLTMPHATMLLLPRFNKKGETKEGLIFPDEKGRWRSPALVSQMIVRRIRKAGIEDASLHSLRHTHATTLLSKGIPVTAVAARLGHKDANIALKAYGHAVPLDDQRVADTWDKLMTGLC